MQSRDSRRAGAPAAAQRILRILGAALLCAAACSSASDALEAAGLEVEGPFTWGELANVTRAGPLYFAGQPDEVSLEKAREEGVGTVINLRNPSEFDWDERAAVEGLGMTYHNIPVRGVDADVFSQIDAIVEQAAREGGVLVHCGSSNRVGAWYARNLMERGHGLDESIEAGRKAGMRAPPLVEGVRSLAGTE